MGLLMSSSHRNRRRNPLLNKLMSREGRKWLYGIALTVVPLLVAYGVIAEDAAPLWVALVGSLLAPALALSHLTPDLPPPGEAPEDL
jgi:hypothetical protein